MSDLDYRSDTHANPIHAPATRGTPGRLPATARLGSVVILRKQDGSSERVGRDASGVASGADDAVARAAASTGAPLPDDVRDRFEASLGADLSSVRVHTGAESQSAARAVGARAYAVGDDIHFGAGQYAPADPFGVHLLAHEVAHTVQQRGAAPQRQDKLEVSAAVDTAELEADRAADAMVSATPFQVAAAPTAIARRAPRPGEPGYDPMDVRLSPDTPKEVPNDPNDVDVVDPGQDTPPREVHWETLAPTSAASLESPPAPMPPAMLTFNELRADWNKSAVAALWGINAQAAAKTAVLCNLVTDLKVSIAIAESASANFVHDDPMVGVGNITPEGADVKLEHAFKDDKVTVGDDKVGTAKLEREDKLEIAKLKRDVQNATGAVRVAHAKVGESFGGVRTALENVEVAKNNLRMADNDTKSAEFEQQAQQLEAEKAKVEGAIDGVKALLDIGKGLADMAGEDPVGGLTDMAGGALDLVKLGATASYDSKINSIKSRCASLAIQNAGLAKQNAVIAYNQAVRGIASALAAVDEANLAYKTAVDDRKAKYMDLSAKLEKAVVANGGSAKDAAKVQSAVQAVPLIEEVLGKLAPIENAAEPPGYTPESGHGASMCTNLDALLAIVGMLKGYGSAARQAAAPWKSRLASVNALIAASK